MLKRSVTRRRQTNVNTVAIRVNEGRIAYLFRTKRFELPHLINKTVRMFGTDAYAAMRTMKPVRNLKKAKKEISC